MTPPGSEKGNIVHLTPSFGPVLHTANLLGAQLHQVSAIANLPNKKTSRLITIKTNTSGYHLQTSTSSLLCLE